MSANSDKLSNALSLLPFVTAVEHEQQESAVNVLCRIKPGCGALWAAVAEKVLREALKRQGTPDYWHTHIARVYMIRNNNLVYGWSFVVMSENPDKTVAIVSNILRQMINSSAQERPKNRSTNSTPVAAEEEEEDDDEPRAELGEDDDYTDPDGPLPKGAVPEADEQGNPIVPRSARVHKIRMAGLPKNYDRNAPDPEKRKGSWQIESRKGKPFRPPVRN